LHGGFDCGYQSKFGDDWDSKLTANSNVKRYQNVIELAEYMVEEGKKIRGLNKGTTYGLCPPGNCPKLMPWDCSLNNDLVHLVMLNTAATTWLSDKSKKKFKLSTPGEITSAYQRIIDSAFPSSKRVEEDVKKVFSPLVEIVKIRGKMVPGLGNRSGRRGQKTVVNWGGKRVKGSGKQYKNICQLHPDALEAWTERKTAVYVLKVDRTTKSESFQLQKEGTGTLADS
jgi:hypothetical protein